ncbi:hypothetical protein MKX01_027437 [Papaver californicum]|nr:hypothetical protein MKX01_027437 [Papaver californicum]
MASNGYRLCNNPGKSNSGGFFYANFNRYDFELNPLPNLALQVAVLLLTPRLVHAVLSRFHIPLFVSQILGGLLFTGTFLGYQFIGAHPELGKKGGGVGIQFFIFPKDRMQVLDTLAHFSSTFFLFKVGVQMDPKMLKTSGVRTYVIGLGCFVCSILVGGFLSFMLKDNNISDLKVAEGNFGFRSSMRILDLFSLVSFPVIAYMLTELNILNSDLGRLALHVAAVANFLHFLVQAYKIIHNVWASTKSSDSSILLVMVGLFIFIVFIVRPAALWIVKNTPEGKPVKESYISLIMILVLVCGLASEYCGFYVMDGAFFLGLAIPDGPPLGTTIVDKLDYMITNFLMPLHMVLVIFGCTLGKIIGVFIPAVFLGVPIQESFLLGLIMNLKGIVEASILNIWLDSENAKEVFYAANTLMSLAMILIAAVVTPLVKYLYDPSTKYLTYKRRSILQSKENKTDFRVLVCVHTQDDVPSIIRILEASNPTKFSPLTIYILHLVELVGRASPLLITHPQHRIATSSNTSKSERIINAFQQMEDRYLNLVSIQAFTTISPYASMHNDICSMSAEKRTALVIFPFCRQDAISLRDDLARPNISNRAIKTLLQNLLRNTPCSVGILIDGNNYQTQSICFVPDRPYRVIVLFFGGPDDREALAFAMNMIHHPSVYVTLVRFYGPESLSSEGAINYYDESISIDMERHKFLDDELVDHFRINTMHDDTLMYKEVEVKDGAETIWAIRSLREDFDLMVVGRQQITDSIIISGLDTEWAECEDLGAVGDMVTSPDYGAEGSILIIHQRQDIS